MSARLATQRDLRQLVQYVRYAASEWDSMANADRIHADYLSRREFAEFATMQMLCLRSGQALTVAGAEADFDTLRQQLGPAGLTARPKPVAGGGKHTAVGKNKIDRAERLAAASSVPFDEACCWAIRHACGRLELAPR
jgi:hypothetical protein